MDRVRTLDDRLEGLKFTAFLYDTSAELLVKNTDKLGGWSGLGRDGWEDDWHIDK